MRREKEGALLDHTSSLSTSDSPGWGRARVKVLCIHNKPRTYPPSAGGIVRGGRAGVEAVSISETCTCLASGDTSAVAAFSWLAGCSMQDVGTGCSEDSGHAGRFGEGLELEDASSVEVDAG